MDITSLGKIGVIAHLVVAEENAGDSVSAFLPCMVGKTAKVHQMKWQNAILSPVQVEIFVAQNCFDVFFI